MGRQFAKETHMHDIQQVFGLGERVAVITGGASGIGCAVSEALASAEARVVSGGLDAVGAEKVAAAIGGAGGEALAQRADVSQRSDLEAPVERASGEWGGVTFTHFSQRHLKNPDGSIDRERYDGFVAPMQKSSPLGIIGEAVHPAWLVPYLASDASRFCNGQNWRKDGGATLPH